MNKEKERERKKWLRDKRVYKTSRSTAGPTKRLVGPVAARVLIFLSSDLSRRGAVPDARPLRKGGVAAIWCDRSPTNEHRVRGGVGTWHVLTRPPARIKHEKLLGNKQRLQCVCQLVVREYAQKALENSKK
ncbi:hypothetical protein V5799_031714 [Amblyomma americanum]|uniref:Uncharacterized protein n=1 Tax=Amblyomma americanum TaxID=6943 RepID=A0AAQ4DT87_AMBAM